MKKLNQEMAQEIINLFVEGDDCANLADEFDVSIKNIQAIIRGITYKQCNRPANIRPIRLNNVFPQFNELQQDVITGSLLGDGSIPHRSNSHDRFVKFQCAKFKEYINWHAEILSPYMSSVEEKFSDKKLVGGVGVEHIECVENRFIGYYLYTHCHPRFTELRAKWYPKDKKIVPNDLKLNPQVIAIWFCDDGSNNFDNRDAVFCTQGFTFEEAELLSNKLAAFDIYPSIRTSHSKATGKKQPFLRISKESYNNLIELITPLIPWRCLQYKIAWRPGRKYVTKMYK